MAARTLRSTTDREAGGDRLQRPVGAGLAQLGGRLAAGGDAHDADADGLGGSDVAGGVADGYALLRLEAAAADLHGAGDRAAGELGAVAGVGAVAAAGEVAVEAPAGQLDVGGRLEVAGGQPEQHALGRQALEQRLDPGHHRVALGGGDRRLEMSEVAGQGGPDLPLLRLTPEQRPQREPRHLWVGHPGLGHLVGVHRASVQLLERPRPSRRAGATAGDQGEVDVEEDGLDRGRGDRVSHRAPRAPPGKARSARWSSCRARARDRRRIRVPARSAAPAPCRARRPTGRRS